MQFWRELRLVVTMTNTYEEEGMNALQVNLRTAVLATSCLLILTAAVTKDKAADERRGEYRSLKQQAEQVVRDSLGSVSLAKDAKGAFDKFLSAGIQKLQEEGATDAKVSEAMRNLKQYCDELRKRAETTHKRKEVTLKNFTDVKKSICLWPFW
jgi:hypothetical protein